MRRDQEMYFESLVLRSFKLYQEAKQPSAVLMSDYSYIDSVTRARLRGRKFVFKYPGSYDMIYWILANTANIALTSSRPFGIAGKLCGSTAVTSWQLQGQG